MKKLSLVFTLSMFVLFSCSENDVVSEVENEEAVTLVTAESFFEMFSDEILELSYGDFVQLHSSVQEKAFEVMTVDKKIDLWQEKLSQSRALDILTDDQETFVKSMQSKIVIGYEGTDEDKLSIDEYFNGSWEKVGFTYNLTHNIFEQINPLNEEGKVIDLAMDMAATDAVFDILKANSMNPRSGKGCPTIEPGGDQLRCALTSCFNGTQDVCFPYLCTSTCENQECGLFGWWTCRYACVPRG